MAQLYPYKIMPADRVINEDIPAVYKLHFGSKYFVWKGKTLKGSVEQNMADIQKLLYRSEDPKHLFSPMINYIRKARPARCEVEIIESTIDPVALVEAERQSLVDGSTDPACLNTKFEPHITKWLEAELSSPRADDQKDITPVKKKHPEQPMFNKKRIDKRIEAIGATLKISDDKLPAKKEVKSTEAPKITPGKVNALLDAVNKIK